MKFTGILMTALLAISCGQTTSQNKELVNLLPEQALDDLKVIVSNVKTLYGPLEYKQRRFGIKLEDLIAQAEQRILAGTTDADFLGALKLFLSSFEDGHVGITFPGNASLIKEYKTGVFLTPLEGKAVVASVEPSITEELGLERGDIVTKVDGKAPFDYLETIKRYEAIGNEVSDQHLIAGVLNRPFYNTELTPTKSYVTLEVEKASGQIMNIELPWIKSTENIAEVRTVAANGTYVSQAAITNSFNQVAKGSLMEMGARDSYFVTPEVQAAFDVVEVAPNAAFLKQYELTPEEVTVDGKFVIYAALYTYQDKTVLLVRQPGYTPKIDEKKMIMAYAALLDQYDGIADVLVLDQNHNPGGSLGYVIPFFQLFVKPGEQKSNFIQHFHADRKWYYDFMSYAAQSTEGSIEKTLMTQRAGYIEAAIGKVAVTEPFPLLGSNMVTSLPYSWTKPMLVLADELAGSCGDIFPMLIKQNKVAKIFGQRTMGLGGNVEEVVTLPSSQAKVKLTRSLFTTYKTEGAYTDADLIENSGVTPDYVYSNTVEDFRNGYPAYFEAMSKQAIAQIPATPITQ